MGGWGANHFYEYFSSHPWLGRSINTRKVLDFICLNAALQHRHWLKPGGSAKSGPLPPCQHWRLLLNHTPTSNILPLPFYLPHWNLTQTKYLNPGTMFILFCPTNLYVHIKEPFASHALQFATKLELLANPPCSYISWHIRIFPSPEDFLIIPKSLPEAVIYPKKYWALPVSYSLLSCLGYWFCLGRRTFSFHQAPG